MQHHRDSACHSKACKTASLHTLHLPLFTDRAQHGTRPCEPVPSNHCDQL
jgi:hypothetical protein